jgi:MYXO-CTERM domain-containing protein
MSQRRPLRRWGYIAGLASPALFLVTLQASCVGQPSDPVAALALEFPDQAASVLGAGWGFVPKAAGFAGDPTEAVRVDLPADGAGEIALHGPLGFEARVREVGAGGAGRLAQQAVAYRRAGGGSFWTTTPGGVEEWLHLAGGSIGAGPIAVWRIEGAQVRARGDVIELIGADGAARVRVTAPEAYAAGGRRIDVHLRAGHDEGYPGTSSIELFADTSSVRGEPVLVDPIWKVVASMSSPRADHGAAITGTGKVLASGGTDGNIVSLDTAALYDPTGDAWTDVGPMANAHVCHTATALNDGTVLIAGGLDATASPQNTTEVYDETAGFNPTDAAMSFSRMNHAAARLADGRVLVTGGLGYYFGGAQKTRTPQIIPVGFTTCWTYGGGGGGSGSGSGGSGSLSSAEIYDPTLSSWTQTSYMFNARERHTETLLPDGTVVVTGGENYGYVESSFEIWDPTTGNWTSPDASLSSSRADHTATLLASGKLLLAGGTDGGGPATASAEILDLTQGGTATASMSIPRAHHTASLLSDGTVLVAGGTDGSSSLATAEVFDPVAGTWTLVPSMASARSDHTATTLTTGDVLVVGGIDDTGSPIAAAELYTNLKPNGSTCTTAGQCMSAFCTEGVCCDTACDSATCQACTVAKGATTDGTCANLDGTTCSAALCEVAGICFGGKCTGAVPKACPPNDSCHEEGICDPGSGSCSSVAKLDGSPCTNGICIAGTCVPDPTLGTGGSVSSTTGTTTTTSTTTTATTTGTTVVATGGSGGEGGSGADTLTGNGCAVSGNQGAGPLPTGGPAALLLAALAAMRQRRGQGSPRRRGPRK